jgi:hypothetical protein
MDVNSLVATVFSGLSGVVVEGVANGGDTVVVTARTRGVAVPCPVCGMPTTRAAEAKGSKGGRRPVPAGVTADVRTAYLEGRSIAALARDHGVSRGAIRTAVADLLPDRTAADEDGPAPELPVTLGMPGKVADFLRAIELEPAERAALDKGVAVQRGTGYTLRVTAVPAVHRTGTSAHPSPRPNT